MIKKTSLLALLMFFICAGSAFCVFDYGRKLYTTSTKYFDIIYAENSKDTAFYIASFADDFFEKINALVQDKWKERITVVISDDHDDAQGYANVTPGYSTITIFDTPAEVDTTVGNSKNFVKYEFFHELTHVISLNTRSKLLEILSKIFGNWVYPQSALPWFMVEGITVSTENSDAREDFNHTDGRINHPWIAEQLKQDIVENRFKNPQQATGTYDTYPIRYIFYHYGGFFNHYIEKKYGAEKYSELWHKTGDKILAAIGNGWQLNGAGVFDAYTPVMFLGNTFGFGMAFKSVYGVSIEDEWKNFMEDMRYKGKLDTNTNTLIDSNIWVDYPVLVKGKLYYIDHFNEAVVCYDIQSKKSVYLVEGEGIESISVSKDGKNMLVNRFVYKDRVNGLTKAVTQFYDLEKRCFTGKEIEGFREVSFFNDGLIGIRAKKHYTDLVKIDLNGNSDIVLAGNDTLYYSTPKQFNDNEIVFLMSDNNIIKIGKYNFETKSAQSLEAPVKYVKNIGVYEGKIFFCYNNDFTFYKMAVADGTNLTIQTNNVSGGVFFPMMENNRIYYAGSFSQGYKFMVYPENFNSLTGTNIAAVYADFNGNSSTNGRIVDYKGTVSDYNAFPYLLPHNWIPMIGFMGADMLDYNTLYSWTTGQQQFNGIDSAGIFTRMEDPTAMNTINLMLLYNFLYPFADVGIDWKSSALPVHFEVIAGDKLKYPLSLYGFVFYSYYRDTSGALDLNYTFNFISQNQYLKIGTTQSYDVNFADFSMAIINPYSWPELQDTYSSKVYFKLADYTMFHQYRTYNYVRGFELNGYYTYNILNQDINNTYWQTGGDLQVYPYYFPLIIKINAAYNSIGILSPYSQGYNEFSYVGLYSYYYTGGDAAAELLNFDTQYGLPLFLPVYINQISWTAGYRNAYLAETYLQSIYSRLTLTMPYMYGSYSQVKVNIFGEVYYAISTGGYGFFIGFDIGKQGQEN